MCCTCKVAFLLIRPTVVFHRSPALPSPLSIIWFYILFEKNYKYYRELRFWPWLNLYINCTRSFISDSLALLLTHSRVRVQLCLRMTRTFLLHRPINAEIRAADSQLDWRIWEFCFRNEKRVDGCVQKFRCHWELLFKNFIHRKRMRRRVVPSSRHGRQIRASVRLDL